MRLAELPISALPAWAKLNDVLLYDIGVQDLGNKGFGFVADTNLSSKDVFDIPTLLRVPKELIISSYSVEEQARVDKDFRELLAAAGGVSTRGDIMLFLLMQLTIASSNGSPNVGVSNPWTEYVRMLPSSVPVPTTWSEEQRMLLIGTSLESAISAKMSALLREFEKIQERTISITWCKKVWWEVGAFNLNDWVLIDSWYRSRCLELPGSEEAMVPCLDIANHSIDANSHYERGGDDDMLLLLKSNMSVLAGQEITISYGPNKSAAEMLFSYGFVDEASRTNSMVLDLQTINGDPLGKAKAAAFSGPPVVSISCEAEAIHWQSPFLYFLCLNEEDGLDFRVLQETDGSLGRLQVFWDDKDVTESTDQFQEHIINHPLKDIFALRAVCLLEARLQGQFSCLYANEEVSTALIESALVGSDKSICAAAAQLRHREIILLEKALGAVNIQKDSLLRSPAVTTYFASMSNEMEDVNTVEDVSNDEDFS